MDARRFLLTLLALISLSTTGFSQVFGQRSVATSPNFRVYARSAALANQVAAAAEENRKQLAVHWLGQEIPNWPQRCPLTVVDGNILANGETKYTLIPEGGVANFQMTVSGTVERIIDSVLPHEITHTILASHFSALGKPIPRWADEGACTTVEHVSERSKHDHMLVKYLSEGRGIPFATLFSLRDYPPDIMPLYAQGYSLSCFLIAQGGPRRFVQFLERGMETDDWVAAVDAFYQYPRIGKLQTAWNRWVGDGGGEVLAYTADSLGLSTGAMVAANAPRSDAAAVRTASAQVPVAPTNPLQTITENSEPTAKLNNSMNTSSGSFYLDELRRNSAISLNAANDADAKRNDGFEPAKRLENEFAPRGVQHSATLPVPYQTLGERTNSGTFRR